MKWEQIACCFSDFLITSYFFSRNWEWYQYWILEVLRYFIVTFVGGGVSKSWIDILKFRVEERRKKSRISTLYNREIRFSLSHRNPSTGRSETLVFPIIFLGKSLVGFYYYGRRGGYGQERVQNLFVTI